MGRKIRFVLLKTPRSFTHIRDKSRKQRASKTFLENILQNYYHLPHSPSLASLALTRITRPHSHHSHSLASLALTRITRPHSHHSPSLASLALTRITRPHSHHSLTRITRPHSPSLAITRPHSPSLPFTSTPPIVLDRENFLLKTIWSENFNKVLVGVHVCQQQIRSHHPLFGSYPQIQQGR